MSIYSISVELISTHNAHEFEALTLYPQTCDEKCNDVLMTLGLKPVNTTNSRQSHHSVKPFAYTVIDYASFYTERHQGIYMCLQRCNNHGEYISHQSDKCEHSTQRIWGLVYNKDFFWKGKEDYILTSTHHKTDTWYVNSGVNSVNPIGGKTDKNVKKHTCLLKRVCCPGGHYWDN